MFKSIFDVNLWGVIIATFVNYGIGALWYMNPFISKRWLKGIGNVKFFNPVFLMTFQVLATAVFMWFLFYVLLYGYTALTLATLAFLLLEISTDLFRGTNKVVMLIDHSYQVIMVVIAAFVCLLMS